MNMDIPRRSKETEIIVEPASYIGSPRPWHLSCRSISNVFEAIAERRAKLTNNGAYKWPCINSMFDEVDHHVTTTTTAGLKHFIKVAWLDMRMPAETEPLEDTWQDIPVNERQFAIVRGILNSYSSWLVARIYLVKFIKSRDVSDSLTARYYHWLAVDRAEAWMRSTTGPSSGVYETWEDATRVHLRERVYERIQSNLRVRDAFK